MFRVTSISILTLKVEIVFRIIVINDCHFGRLVGFQKTFQADCLGLIVFYSSRILGDIIKSPV